MTYEAQEGSTQDGAPIFLYTFTIGVDITRFTSRETDFAFTSLPSEIYAASAMRHSDIRSTANPQKEAVTLEFPASDTFAQSLTDRGTAQGIMTIRRTHVTDSAEEARVIWQGFVKRAVRRRTRIVVTVTPYSDRVRRYSQALRTQRRCLWTQYGGDTAAGGPCTLNAVNFQTTVSVTAISGRVLTIPDLSSAPTDDHYLGGEIEYNGEKRRIEAFDQTATTITLIENLAALDDEFASSPPVNVNVAPGCRQDPAVCDSVFDNLAECAACTELPTIDVFGKIQRIDQ